MARFVLAVGTVILGVLVANEDATADSLVLVSSPSIMTSGVNSFAFPGRPDSRGKPSPDSIASQVRKAAKSALERSGYRVQLDPGTAEPDFALAVSIDVKRDYREVCAPKEEKQGCLDLALPEKQGAVAPGYAMADELNVSCELRRLTTREVIWRGEGSVVAAEDRSPIPLGTTHVDQLVERALRDLPTPQK